VRWRGLRKEWRGGSSGGRFKKGRTNAGFEIGTSQLVVEECGKGMGEIVLCDRQPTDDRESVEEGQDRGVGRAN